MKIQKVKIKEFKCLKDVEKEINGANLLLIGDNGVGKSSLMQFIEIALGKSTKIPPNAKGEGLVIANRHGEEFLFEVKFKDGKPNIVVTDPNGLKDNRKSALASIVGAIDFDINQFVSLSDSSAGRKKQVEIFKSLLPVEVREELEKYEVNISTTYEARTDTNRKIKDIKGFLKSSDLYGTHLDVKNVDVSDLSNKLVEQNKVNATIEDVDKRYHSRAIEIDELTTKLSELKAKQIQAKEYLEANKHVDTTHLQEQIKNASKINEHYHEAQELIKKEASLEALENESGEMTALIDSSKQAIEDTIKQMDSPVEGLFFDEDGLVYKGVPVSTASLSTSEIIELGCKLKMADNQDFGVLLIEHGESLGTERLNHIKEMAKENDWQLIIEQVERGTKELKIEFLND